MAALSGPRQARGVRGARQTWGARTARNPRTTRSPELPHSSSRFASSSPSSPRARFRSVRSRRFPPRRLRRLLAVALVAAAATIAVADMVRPESGTVPVVVAARDVESGRAIEAADVAIRMTPEDHVPDQAFRDAEAVVGKLPAGPLTRGEALTEPRFAGPRLAEALTGADDANIVAVTPRDTGLVPLLRTGDVVDVLAAGHDAGSSRPVARGARVVLTDDDGVVLLALGDGAAATVAAAGLELPLTLVLSG